MSTYALDARTATDHFPGIGRYVSNLARAMAGQLTPGERLLLLRDPVRPTRWRPPEASDQVIPLATTVSPFSLRQQWEIPRLLRQQRADVYHSPYYLMPYRPGQSTVLTLYDLIPRRFPATVSLRARLLFRLTTALALRSSNHIIAISEATRRDLMAAYDLPSGRVTAIPLAPDPQFRLPVDATARRIRERYDLPELYALYLGINKPHKNLSGLLHAWQLISEATTDSSLLLVIAGAWDPRYPEPRQLAAELGLDESIRFLGPMGDEDLPSLYAGAMFFVFPSLYEGFGLPVIEAMACGTAVVCSNRSSIPEVAGEAALYFNPERPRQMAGQMLRLIGDKSLREELGQAGLDQVARFSWERTAAATLAIYRALAAETE